MGFDLPSLRGKILAGQIRRPMRGVNSLIYGAKPREVESDESISDEVFSIRNFQILREVEENESIVSKAGLKFALHQV